VEKCFSKCGFPTSSSSVPATSSTSADSTDFDEEDDLPLSTLLQSAKDRLDLPEPMSLKEFLSCDSNLQLCEDYSEGWEDRAAEEHSSTSPAADDDPEPEPTKPAVSSVYQAMNMIRDIQAFCNATVQLSLN